jgi:AcrR family transcriptional regulator
VSATVRPTRREERRAETVKEIKHLAMKQISEGGPDAVSLSGIVREMSMSPPALYRYFANRDALLADLVVDAYDELAASLAALGPGTGSAEDHLDAVLHGLRAWALANGNAYRLIFQTSIGSGTDLAPDRTIPASSRSMAVLVEALAGVTGHDGAATAEPGLGGGAEIREAFRVWAKRSDVHDHSLEVLQLAFLTWTRLHGIISLELGGHLAATGIGASVLFDDEVRTITARAASLPATGPNR